MYTGKTTIKLAWLFTLVMAVSTISVSNAHAEQSARLTISVIGMTSEKGRIQSFLCRKDEEFPNRCRMFSVVPSADGVVDVVYSSVKPGTYAFTTFHDENSDFKLGFSKLGFPNEGVGFSGDTKKLANTPSFEDSAFDVDGDKKIIVKLIYLSDERAP